MNYNGISASMFKPEQDIGLSKKEKLRIRWSGRIPPEEFGKPEVLYIKKCFNKYTVSFPLRHPYEYVKPEFNTHNKRRYLKKTKPDRLSNHVLGIDPGQEPLLTTHEGDKIHNIYDLMPEEAVKKCSRLEKRIARIQEILAWKRKVWKDKGYEFNENRLSKSYLRYRYKLARLHYELDNIKKHWIGVFASQLAKRKAEPIGVIVIEKYEAATHKKRRTYKKEDGTKVKYKMMGKKIQRNSPTRLIKALLDAFKYRGKRAVVIDSRNYAPIQTCSSCGHRLHGENKLKPKVKEWICPSCNTHHDRDINAAWNIRNIAWKVLPEVKRYEVYNVV